MLESQKWLLTSIGNASTETCWFRHDNAVGYTVKNLQRSFRIWHECTFTLPLSAPENNELEVFSGADKMQQKTFLEILEMHTQDAATFSSSHLLCHQMMFTNEWFASFHLSYDFPERSWTQMSPFTVYREAPAKVNTIDVSRKSDASFSFFKPQYWCSEIDHYI